MNVFEDEWSVEFEYEIPKLYVLTPSKERFMQWCSKKDISPEAAKAQFKICTTAVTGQNITEDNLIILEGWDFPRDACSQLLNMGVNVAKVPVTPF